MNDTAAFVIRSFPFPLPSVLSILQILFYPPGFQRIFGFREVSTGQGLLSHAGGYLCPVAFLPYIAFLCIQFSWYNAAVRREMFSVIDHRSFVCRCCRFSSASISGGIRSTSRCKSSSSLFSFARSIVSFILPFSLALALASNCC